MTAYAPILIAVLFVLVAFSLASSKGVVGLLASGMAAAVGVAILLAGFQFLPGLAKTYLGVGLTWQVSLALSAGAALAAFLFLRIILALVLKHLFHFDGWLHRFADGTPGGILSLGPSLVAVFVFFTCVRAAGTVQELNYIDSLARPGIRDIGGQIPAYPISATWRNAIERLPFLAAALDATDPFSRRSSRNTAAFVLAQKGASLRTHLLGRPETGLLMEAPNWVELPADREVADALAKLDRVSLVTAPAVQRTAADPSLRPKLVQVVFEPGLKDFVLSLIPEPVETPEPVL